MKQKDLILYSGLIILGLAAPFLFSAFKVQLTYLCVLIVLAMTWNLQGGEMGYNSFGNILFYGLGMYLTASVQVGMFFPLAEWTESGGEKTFVHTTAQNARAAKILGVDTEKVYAATFGINAALCGVAGALISITLTLHPYVGLPYTVRSFMIVIVAGLGNLPAVAISGMGLGLFEEFADYILGTEFRIGAVFMLLVFILVYRRFKLSKKREYLK